MDIEQNDPRRLRIIAALKRKSGASKVTMLEELDDGSFKGHCFRVRPTHVNGGAIRSQLESLGFFIVTKQDVGL